MKTEWKGGTLLAPVPAVMVTVGNEEKANIITVAWTGIVCSEPPKTYISVRPERYSYGLLRESGEFVIHLTTVAMAKACDYCGMVTGRKIDKFRACGFTREKSASVSTPRIAESPLALECRVTDVVPLGSHDMFLADIQKVIVEERLLDENGRLDLGRADLACYAHGAYFSVGKEIGRFGFSVARRETEKRAAPSSRREKHPQK